MRLKAMLVAVLTTVLWSGSFIVNRWAFEMGMGPLTLSGFRYTLASLLIMAVMRSEKNDNAIDLPLLKAFWIGLISYVVGQGFQYIGQSMLTPTLSGLFLNAGMVLFVVLIDKQRLHENVGKSLYAKIALILVGILLYYQPWSLHNKTVDMVGIVFVLLASFGGACNIAINRHLLKNKKVDRRQVTTKPMLCGGLVLLCSGLLTETLPVISLKLLLLLLYLVVISGAIGFSFWIWSQQYLNAVESGCINNGMLAEIAILDVLCFGRVLSVAQWSGILLVLVGILWVQFRKQTKVLRG